VVGLIKTIILLIIFIIFALIVNGIESTFKTLVLAGLTAIFVRIILGGD